MQKRILDAPRLIHETDTTNVSSAYTNPAGPGVWEWPRKIFFSGAGVKVSLRGGAVQYSVVHFR